MSKRHALNIWTTAFQEMETSLMASHMDKEEGTTMSREGETKLHMEEKTESTHPREEGAETAVTHDFASIATKWSTILLLLIQNLIRLKEG